MIVYKKGDLLRTPDRVIIHGCNTRGAMGAGVALAIRERWPEVYKAYRYACDINEVALGGFLPTETDCGKIVLNAITQANYGKGLQVSYPAIESALTQCQEWMEVQNYSEASMPKIGAGYGGGSWEQIEKIVENVFKNQTISIYYL